MRSMQLTACNGETSLAGELTLPDGGHVPPVVLMLHGSGPLDRNQNMRGQRLDIFNALAEAFARAGYASLRFDKRGCGQSSGDYSSHGIEDLVGDARAWIELLRNRTDVGEIYLLGHSEGTLIAPLAAGAGTEVTGLVLICPFIQPTETILLAQAQRAEELLDSMEGISGRFVRAASRIFGRPMTNQKRIIRRLRETDDNTTVRFSGRKLPARSLRDLLNIDPRAVHSANSRPTFVLAAGKDVQCDPADGREIAALNPNTRLIEEPNLTHLLRMVDGPAGFASYRQQIREPIAPVVSEHITGWLNEQAKTVDTT